MRKRKYVCCKRTGSKLYVIIRSKEGKYWKIKTYPCDINGRIIGNQYVMAECVYKNRFIAWLEMRKMYRMFYKMCNS